MRTRTPVILVAGVAATLLLAGCSPTRATPGSPEHSSGATAAATHDRADVTFAEAMIPHHAQAVRMSDLLLEKTGVDPAVLALAKRIRAAQAPEMTELEGFLTSWDRPTVAPAPTGMSGGAMGDGMMSGADMTELQRAGGAAAATLYLRQMTRHHTGAITMAETEVRTGSNTRAVALAKRIVADQSAELTTMAGLLRR